MKKYVSLENLSRFYTKLKGTTLDTLEEIQANKTGGKIAGALAVKELNNKKLESKLLLKSSNQGLSEYPLLDNLSNYKWILFGYQNNLKSGINEITSTNLIPYELFKTGILVGCMHNGDSAFVMYKYHSDAKVSIPFKNFPDGNRGMIIYGIK